MHKEDPGVELRKDTKIFSPFPGVYAFYTDDEIKRDKSTDNAPVLVAMCIAVFLVLLIAYVM
ncbi:MAG: hypothetical protein KBF66_16260 [Rhodoferax sp.]|jgi:hypothetical protein|uniref:hypothetical protein n=1 Tax=Rhodoferax sp. TaxID=50421 RepID=UPI001B6BCD3D|nr:hypothetical protein [Rhodoferax sp.]MBP9907103.1 hypothetical protein [Rhodoferax sp.]